MPAKPVSTTCHASDNIYYVSILCYCTACGVNDMSWCVLPRVGWQPPPLVGDSAQPSLAKSVYMPIRRMPSGASVSGASVSGASVSGASVSGASVSGASVSGASVSGASVRCCCGSNLNCFCVGFLHKVQFNLDVM